MQRSKVLVIVGPTASGKSALGVELALRFNGEVISADSRQVYHGLDIGTGKITKREMRGVPHHLLDVVSPKRTFSANNFRTFALHAIASNVSRGKLTIVVGGTGFYIDTLLGRIALPDVPPDAKLRKRLAAKSAAELYVLLKKKDPARAASMNTPSERNNKVRLIRALEIVDALGTVPQNIKDRTLYDVLWIGIAPSEAELEMKIHKRLRERLKKGMVSEARRLHTAGLSYRRMEELGLEYRSLARFLQGMITRTELEQELARDIRRYARKQLTYWKRNREIRWFKASERKCITTEVRAWLGRHEKRPLSVKRARPIFHGKAARTSGIASGAGSAKHRG